MAASRTRGEVALAIVVVVVVFRGERNWKHE